MNITQEDLKDLNTYGYKYTLEQGCLTIDLPHAIVTVHKRPSYCDRGRYGFSAEVKRGFHDKMSIDWADAFPRYFFNLQRSLEEMNDWIIFNKQKLGITAVKEKILCDGCNVREGHEHRCHGNNIQIFGEPTNKKCQCDWKGCKLIQH